MYMSIPNSLTFDNSTLKAWSIHGGKKLNVTLLKLKTSALQNDNIKRAKRQVTDWEKLFAKDTSDKGLLYKIYKELLKQWENKQSDFKMHQWS